jgi:hypothetical protein
MGSRKRASLLPSGLGLGPELYCDFLLVSTMRSETLPLCSILHWWGEAVRRWNSHSDWPSVHPPEERWIIISWQEKEMEKNSKKNVGVTLSTRIPPGFLQERTRPLGVVYCRVSLSFAEFSGEKKTFRWNKPEVGELTYYGMRNTERCCQITLPSRVLPSFLWGPLTLVSSNYISAIFCMLLPIEKRYEPRIIRRQKGVAVCGCDVGTR